MKAAAIFTLAVTMFFAGCASTVACFMAGKCTIGGPAAHQKEGKP